MSELIVTKAHIKGVDQTPRKVSLVASLVRGRTVADALVILEHTPKRSALVVKKAIASAKANAINNNNVDGKTLVIKTLSVTTGPRMKRFKPASRGRALPFVKKSSHILVEVVGTEKAKKKPVVAAEKPAAAKAESKKPAVKAKGEK